MYVGIGLVVLPIILFTYKRMNARGDAVMREAGEKGWLQYSDHELRRMGDRAPDFRYTLYVTSRVPFGFGSVSKA
jgi:hypothetical protein